MNYLEYFGLQAEPFLNSSSSRVFYKSAIHGKALLQLMTAADADTGLFLLLGDSGVGKSLLLRKVLETVSEESTRAALLPVPVGGLTERHVVRALGHQLRLHGEAGSLAMLNESIAELANEGTKVLILIDDAHRLTAELLGLLGAMASASVVFAGEPNAGYPQSISFVVSPLNAEAADAFVRLRLKVAGRVPEIFSADARKLVHAITRGNPARINAVCEQALLACALAGMEKIDEKSVLTTGVALGLCDENAKPVETAPVAAARPAAPAPAVVAATVAVAKPVESLDDVLSQLENDDADEAESAPPVVAPPSGVVENTDDFDSMLGQLADDDEEAGSAAPPQAADEGDDLDAMMSELTESDAPVAASGDDSDLDSMLNELAADDADDVDDMSGVPETAAKPSQVGDDLDDLMGGLEDEDEAVFDAVSNEAAANKRASDSADELDGLLDSMGADEEVEALPAAKPVTQKSVPDDDLDSLLDGLDGLDGLDDEEEAVPAPVAKPAPAKAAKKAAPAPALVEEDDFDSMLSGLDDELNAGTSDAGDATSDELDDLLGGLDMDAPPSNAKGAAAAKATDDDLDDLLAGLDDEDVPPPAPKPQAKAAPAKTKAATKPVAVPADDELSDLLDSLNDESLDIEVSAPAKGKKKPQATDNLENELDSLLEGLDD